MDFLDQLRDQVYHDVMACIGCNDCLLACPLPESGEVTIAELNHAALAEQIVAPSVVDFVTRCTQCQQCVAVCPADLSRANIVLWNQMKVQSVAPDRVVPLQVGERIVDSSWSVDHLARHLRSLPLFDDVDRVPLRRALLSTTLRKMAAGDVLSREGEYYERLLVVVDGALEQSTTTPDGERTRILVLGPGTFHGYMAVMGGTREPFTISAVEDSTVVEFTKAAVFLLMRESAAFGSRMESIYRDRAVWTHMRASPLLAAIPEEVLGALLEDATLRVLRPGEVLYREGDPVSAVHVVRSGFLRVARRFGGDERVLQYFHEGEVCGVSSLLFARPHSATVSANTRVEVVAIPAKALTALLARNPGLQSGLATEALRADRYLDLKAPRPPVKGRPSEHLLSVEGLLDQGVMQGHEVLVINTAICTNCNNCVDACGRRHGYSRLDRSGLQMGSLLFPTACRHCEDPVCLLCSVNGIVREPDGEIRIVTDSCIGCGACAERCPYDNINIHPRRPERRSVRSRLLGLFTGTDDDDDPTIHTAGVKGERVAVKCDLCSGYDDYACVTACPVGAAMRIDPVAVFGRSDLLIGLEQKKGDQAW